MVCSLLLHARNDQHPCSWCPTPEPLADQGSPWYDAQRYLECFP